MIKWTRPARSDVDSIGEYLAENADGETARMVISGLAQSVKPLADLPGRGRPGRIPGTRELVVQGYPYVVVYREKANAVEILRVLHTSRQWPTG